MNRKNSKSFPRFASVPISHFIHYIYAKAEFENHDNDTIDIPRVSGFLTDSPKSILITEKMVSLDKLRYVIKTYCRL